jgi:mono/diheme cytochrome c family protein
VRFLTLVLAGCSLLLGGCTSQQQSSPLAGGDAARGQQLFTAACAVCHHADSLARKVGPGLQGLFALKSLPNGEPVNDATVANWVRNGGGQMPPFRAALNSEQLRDLLAYLKTL